MVRDTLISFYRDEAAESLIEYAVIFSFIGMVVVPAIIEYRDWLIGKLDDITDSVIQKKPSDF